MSDTQANLSSAVVAGGDNDVPESKAITNMIKGVFTGSSASGSSASVRPTVVDTKYKMDHPRRGVAVIFNMEEFDRKTGFSNRNGTEQDKEALTKTLSDLNFKDVRVYNNLDKEEVIMYLRILSQEDHTQADCLLIAFLSHGEQNTVFASDGNRIELEELHEPFTPDQCGGLAEKPKIFIIQACQGKLTDAGTLLERRRNDHDSDSRGSAQIDMGYRIRIPNRADFITVWSTVPRYVAFLRCGTGSWFIQTLTRVMDEHARNLDFLSLVTYVAREVAETFSSRNDDPMYNDKKQVPYTMSTLTREIRF